LEYNRTRQKETRQTLKILRIRWPDTISNEELHGRAETTKAMEVIIQKRWSWIGYALRMDKNRIGTTALKWQSEVFCFNFFFFLYSKLFCYTLRDNTGVLKYM
jgi:hypothetical protein